MKYSLAILGCILTLMSCNIPTTKVGISNQDSLHTPIPPNSIYQQGDIVYELDSMQIRGGIIRIDGFAIYRVRKHEVIFDLGIDKGTTTEFVYRGFPKDTAGMRVFIFDNPQSNNTYSMSVKDKWIFWIWDGENAVPTHISSVVKY